MKHDHSKPSRWSVCVVDGRSGQLVGITPFLEPVGYTHPASSVGLHYCTDAGGPTKTRHFAPRLEGGSGCPRAERARRMSKWHRRIGNLRRAFRVFDYTVARVVPKRHAGSGDLFTMFNRGCFNGISAPVLAVWRCGLGGETRVERETQEYAPELMCGVSDQRGDGQPVPDLSRPAGDRSRSLNPCGVRTRDESTKRT